MTDEENGTGDVLLRLAARLREDQIFGPPVERGGVTVVPVAKIRAGGGIGRARERGQHQANGGGFGFVAHPVGAWVVEDSGRVRWRPAIDLTRIALGAQFLAGLLVIGLMLRRRLRAAVAAPSRARSSAHDSGNPSVKQSVSGSRKVIRK
jgi:hypothetical protein